MSKNQSIQNIDKKAKIFTGKKLYIIGSVGFRHVFKKRLMIYDTRFR